MKTFKKSVLRFAYGISLLILTVTIASSYLGVFVASDDGGVESLMALINILTAVPLWLIALARSYAGQKILWTLLIFLLWPSMYFFALFVDEGDS